MAPHKTITINGRLYDAVTGLPVEAEKSAPKAPTPAPRPAPKPVAPAKPKVPRPAGTPRPDVIRTVAPKVVAKPAVKPEPKKAAPATPRSKTAAEAVHSTVQRSQTLNRRAAKKPAVPNRPITRRKAPGRLMDVAKSSNITRFAAHPVTSTPAAKPATPEKPDKPAQMHPVVHRALQRTTAKKPAVSPKPASAKEVKDAAIAKALAAPTKKATPHKKSNKKHVRRLVITIASIVVFLAAVLVAYFMLPSISVSIASARAGISASYPEYTPDGYSLSQPVKFEEGQVALKFASNSNDNFYTITQTRSSWDSSAVLDNVVTPTAGADYVTTKERGLTIYSFESAAVWVNGGILYKIDSKAPLSGDQIRKIATSL